MYIKCLKILTIPTSRFIIMLNWLSYQYLKSWDYQRLDCMDCAKFLADVRPFPAQREKGKDNIWRLNSTLSSFKVRKEEPLHKYAPSL